MPSATSAPRGHVPDKAAVESAAAAWQRSPGPIRLLNNVQHYDWGDPVSIPRLLGRPNPQGEPFAELWIGSHPDLPSLALIDGQSIPLDRLIAAAPRPLLGSVVAHEFDARLPFLLKVLAAAKPLSLQAHPNRAQAQAGYADEQARGISLQAPERSYRDPHHKPELLVAMTDFFALRGFRPLDEIQGLLQKTPELAPLAADACASEAGLRRLYERVMRAEPSLVNQMLGPLLARFEEADRQRPLSPDQHAYWLLEADRTLPRADGRDRGLLAMLLLNLAHLQPGQAIFLPAGELHCYLRGTGLELMASSNNVLRGGLTSKHVDVEALLGILTFDAAPLRVIEPERLPAAGGTLRYRPPVREFALECLTLQGERLMRTAGGVEILLVTTGRLIACTPGGAPVEVPPGEALLLPSGLPVELTAPEHAGLAIASVPPGDAAD